MRARGVVVGGVVVVAALVVGAGLLWAEPVEVGWFAYADSAVDATPQLFVLTARREAALVLAGVGLLVLGALLGFALGRRGASSGVR